MSLDNTFVVVLALIRQMVNQLVQMRETVISKVIVGMFFCI